MKLRQLSVPDAWEVTPRQIGDDRGVFFEWYRFDRLREAIGHAVDLRQANASVSRRGVVRGVHFADVPRGQAKFVTVFNGAAVDYVIDIRVGSPTFGEWDSVLLDTVDRRAVYIAEGLGHCFVALSPETTVSYLVSDTYNPGAEHGVSPLDPEIGLIFPLSLDELVLSSKDRDAPALLEARESGLLPSWDAMRAYYEELRQ